MWCNAILRAGSPGREREAKEKKNAEVKEVGAKGQGVIMGCGGKPRDLGNSSKGEEWDDWSHWEELEDKLKEVESK